jgi:Ca2+/Na+ antiporter
MIILIILGIILVVTSFTLKTDQNPLSKFSNLFKIIGVLLIAGGIFSSAFKQVDAGTVGVTTLYGNVQTGILRRRSVW